MARPKVRLGERDANEFRNLAREGLKQYGLTMRTLAEAADARRDDGDAFDFIRNALARGRPVSPQAAIDVLLMIAGSGPARAWRRKRSSSSDVWINRWKVFDSKLRAQREGPRPRDERPIGLPISYIATFSSELTDIVAKELRLRSVRRKDLERAISGHLRQRHAGYTRDFTDWLDAARTTLAIKRNGSLRPATKEEWRASRRREPAWPSFISAALAHDDQ